MNSQELEFILKMRDEATAILERVGGGFDKAGKGAKGFSNDNQKVAGSLDQVVKSAKDAAAALAGVYASTQSVGKAVSSWGRYELGIVGVVKTTNLAGRELANFRDQFDQLNRTMNGISTQQLAQLSETVGQMGVQGVDNIISMTEVLGQLGVTSDVVGQQGATMIARILNLTGEGAEGVRQFGDALNYLGNNSAVSESEILNMAASVAQATAEFGISSKELLAVSAAARELDLNFEVTGSAFGRVLRNLRDGSATGAKSFQTFLKQAQLTEDQFQQLLKDDPTELLVNFAQVYANLTKSGQSVPFLEALGLNTDEIKRVFGSIGSQVDNFRDTMNLVEGDQWIGALEKEAKTFFGAQENQIEGLKKAWDTAWTAMGEALAPLVGPAIQALTAGIYAVVDAFNSMPGVIKTVVATALTLGPAVLALIPAIRLASAAFALLGGKAMFAGLFSSLSAIPALLSGVRTAFISTVAGATMLAKTSAIMTATTGQAITGLIAIIKGMVPAFRAAMAAALLFSRQAIAAMVRLGVVILATSGNLLTMIRNFSLMGAAARGVGLITAAFTVLRGAIVAIPALLAAIPAAIAAIPGIIASLPAILVAAIAAAMVAVGVVIYRNWDEIVAFFSQSWTEIGQQLWETLTAAFDATVQYFTDKWDSFVSWLTGEETILEGVELRPTIDPTKTKAAVQEAIRGISLTEDDFKLFAQLVPNAQDRKELQQFTALFEKLGKATSQELADFGIKPEELRGAREMLALREKIANDPLFTSERGLQDQIADAQALTSEQRNRLEIERTIRDIAEQTGVAYDDVKRRLTGVIEELQKARQNKAFYDQLQDLDAQIDAAKAVTAEAKQEVEVRNILRDLVKETGELEQGQVDVIRQKVAALNEAKKAAAFNDALTSAQRDLEIARATTEAEKQRLQIKYQIADFEKANGALSSDQKAQLEAALAAKNLAEAYNNLRSSLDPVGEATRQYEEKVQQLNAALASGQITAQQYQQMLNTLNVTTQDARDPFGAQVRSLQEAMDAARITGDYRSADVKTLNTINQLQRQGVQLSQAQKDQIAAMNRELQDIEKSQSSGLQGWINSVGSLKDNLMDLTQEIAGGLSDAITGVLTGAQGSWTNFLRSIASSMVKIGVNQLLKNLFQGVQGGASGMGSGISGFFSKLFGGGQQAASPAATDTASAVQSAVQQMATASMTVNAATVMINGTPLGVPGAGVPGLTSNTGFSAPVGSVTRSKLPDVFNPQSWGLRGSISPTSSASSGLNTSGWDLRGAIETANDNIAKTVPQAVQSAAGNFAKQISLTPKEILDLKKTLSTEWVTSAGEMQGKGIIDTILNRKASGKWGDSITDVVNARAQFSDINSVLTDKKGRWTVDALPDSILNSRKGQMSSDLVDRWLAERAGGAASSVGDNLNYANPFYSSKSNLPWINALEGPVYGSGKAIHRHGTTPELQRWRPGEFGINLPGQGGVDAMTTGSIPQVTQITEQFKQQMTTANTALAQAMPQQFTPAFQNVGQQFQQVFSSSGQALQGIAPQFQNIAQQAQAVVPNLGQFGSSITGLMGPLMQAPAATGQFGQSIMQLIQQMGSGMGGGFGGFFGLLGGLFHKGGDVGAGIPASGLRMMPANTWASAVKHHNGLKSSEYPAILKRGEKVLTANDNMRNMAVIEGLTSRLDQQNRQQARNDRTRFGNQNFNQNITVYADDANSFRKSEGQLMADSSVQMRRLAGRNS